MTVIERSIQIEAHPDAVWRAIVDVARWPEWNQSVRDVRLLDPGELAIGSRVQVTQPRLPTAVWSVTVLDTAEYFEWRNESTGLVSVAGHRLEAKNGVTRVTLSVTWAGPAAWLIALVFGRLSAKYVEMEASGLKARCETAHVS